MASLAWFFGGDAEVRQTAGQVHLEEMWKKRTAYGFVTAVQLEEKRALHSLGLQEEDWLNLDECLARLSLQSNDGYNKQRVANSNAA